MRCSLFTISVEVLCLLLPSREKGKKKLKMMHAADLAEVLWMWKLIEENENTLAFIIKSMNYPIRCGFSFKDREFQQDWEI
jgi:hypothetical protein